MGWNHSTPQTQSVISEFAAPDILLNSLWLVSVLRRDRPAHCHFANICMSDFTWSRRFNAFGVSFRVLVVQGPRAASSRSGVRAVARQQQSVCTRPPFASAYWCMWENGTHLDCILLLSTDTFELPSMMVQTLASSCMQLVLTLLKG